MNILFYVGGYNFYGSERKLLTIMKGLKERGHNVHCITNGWSDGVFNEALKQNNISFSSSKLGFIYIKKILWTLDSLINYPGAVYHHIRSVNKFKPDIIYHNNFRSILMLWWFLNTRKNVYHVGDLENINFKNRLKFHIVSIKVKTFIANGHTIKDNIKSLIKANKEIRIVYNGIDNSKFNIRKKVKRNFTIGVIGQLIDRKGQLILLKAIKILISQGADLRCLIFGDGNEDYINQLKEYIYKNELTKYVKFMGYSHDKNQIYNLIHVSVVPSIEEAFANSAIEAGFYKVPVIGSNVGGIAEIIRNDENGYLFKNRDENDLAEKLYLFYSNPKLIDSIGNKAFEYVNIRFSMSRMINEIESILENVKSREYKVDN